MPKVQIKRKNPAIDMTAMTDVAFLLLTFFMLTTKFKPDEPFAVQTPSSISEVKLPESDIMQISIDKDSKVFFSIDGQQTRQKLLEKMGTQYNIQFTADEVTRFKLLENVGMPIQNLKQYLNMRPEDRVKVDLPGVPFDSTNNQLRDWIWFGRLANNNVRIAIKGDQEVTMPVVKEVINTLQDRKVNKFNFITSLETGN